MLKFNKILQECMPLDSVVHPLTVKHVYFVLLIMPKCVLLHANFTSLAQRVKIVILNVDHALIQAKNNVILVTLVLPLI